MELNLWEPESSPKGSFNSLRRIKGFRDRFGEFSAKMA
jgi:hypothetical protein